MDNHTIVIRVPKALEPKVRKEILIHRRDKLRQQLDEVEQEIAQLEQEPVSA